MTQKMKCHTKLNVTHDINHGMIKCHKIFTIANDQISESCVNFKIGNVTHFEMLQYVKTRTNFTTCEM